MNPHPSALASGPVIDSLSPEIHDGGFSPFGLFNQGFDM
jgi:hypothetical protein